MRIMKLALVLLLVAASQAAHLGLPLVEVGDGVSSYESRIVNGQQATRGQFPHQAAVVVDGTTFCGGSLLSTEWVLTAAHCADGTASSWEVTLGGQQRSDNEPGRVTIVTSNVIVHEQFDASVLANDIALIRLPPGLELTEWIQPVTLPTWSDALTNETFTGSQAVVSGWGKDGNNATEVSDQLNYATVSVISNTQCASTYGGLVTESVVCTAGTAGVGSCNGDSGGPLILAGGAANPKQIGVVSFVSSKGCDNNNPSGFARLTSHLQWISDKTGIVIQD